MSLFTELKRRNVFRVAAAYAVTAWLMVQVVETLFPIYGLSDTAVRIVVNLLAIGLVPVLVLSWVFEWTPEGLKREVEAGLATPASLKAAKRLDRIILVALALALGYFAFDKFVLAPQREATVAEQARQEGRSEALVESYGDQSIAVLAFEDMSPDKDQEYLSDGISEEILNLLAEIPELRVISRTSAFSYKGKEMPIPEIARQLNVAHVLEGSVRKAGDRVRITAQLIEARSDTHIWSKTYDRTLDDIFAIQDELAAAMVDQLQLTLLEEIPQARRVDPEAYLLYLEGHRLVAYVDAERAALLLEQAVEIAPEFADAWWDLMRANLQKSTTNALKDHEGDAYWFKADQAWKRLVELDPDHPGVLSGQAWDAVAVDEDYVAAARLFEEAIERYPHDWRVVHSTIHFARWIRRDDIALVLAESAVARDPLCTDCSYQYARTALFAGRPEEAEREILRYRALVPEAVEGGTGSLTFGRAKVLAGDFEGAREAFRIPAAGHEQNPVEAEARELYGELLVQLAMGEREGVTERIESLAGLWADQDPRAIAELYAMAGAIDEAFAWLDRLAETSLKTTIAFETKSLLLANLHDDPRWLELLEYAGVAPHQLAEIEFDPKLTP